MFFRNATNDKIVTDNYSHSENFSVIHIAPFAKHMNTQICPKMMRVLSSEEKVSFLKDGNLLVENQTHFQIYKKGFCIDNFLTIENNQSLIYMSAFLCKNEEPFVEQKKLTLSSDNDATEDHNETNQKLRFWLTVSGFISILSLLLTLFFYKTLPDLYNFQGHIVCCYIFSMLITTTLLIAIYNVKLEVQTEEPNPEQEFFFSISLTGCRTIGYLLYFSVMLMFTWMSILCFDLFWTFVCRPMQIQETKNNARLCFYVLVGTCVPIAMTTSIYLVDHFKVFKTRPEVGYDRCFLSHIGARFYFNYPILILLAFNTIIFIATTSSLWKRFRDNKMATLNMQSQRGKVIVRNFD